MMEVLKVTSAGSPASKEKENVVDEVEFLRPPLLMKRV